MVQRKAVGLHEDEVVERLVLNRDIAAKKVVRGSGISTPDSVEIGFDQEASTAAALVVEQLGLPVMLKPVARIKEDGHISATRGVEEDVNFAGEAIPIEVLVEGDLKAKPLQRVSHIVRVIDRGWKFVSVLV